MHSSAIARFSLVASWVFRSLIALDAEYHRLGPLRRTSGGWKFSISLVLPFYLGE